MSKIRMTTLQKIGFGAGDSAINLSMISAGMLIYAFHVQIVGLTPVDAGWLLLLVRCIDAVTDPAMGWMTNRYKTRFGHYRHWIGFAAIPMGVSMYLMFTTVGDTYNVKLAWAYTTYIFNTLMFTMVSIPYISMIGVITNDPDERITANSWRFTMAKAATLLCTSLVPYWVTSHDNQVQGYATSFMILGVIGAACLLFCAYHTKEVVDIEPNKQPVKEQLKSLLRNDQWVVLCAACITLMLAFLVRGNIAFIYATEFAGASFGLQVSIFLGMWSVGGILAAMVSKQLTRRYCKIKVFRFSMYASALMGVSIYFLVSEGQYIPAVLCYFLYCFLTDLNTPIFWALISEVSDYGKKKTGIDASGISMGAISFCQKLGMGLSGIVTGYTLQYFGYSADAEKTADVLNGLSLSLSIAPALFFLLTGLIIKKYFITTEYYNKMMNGEIQPSKTVSNTTIKSQA
ncbi:glycoside-pentoside-hexuronide (GPH):cation symporter (plasmid) [Photobacterium sp. DA100]|uniref:MFS transporter n=1 Tax=Photobacterium sp. DA100 TaxID=3027472 RepID=UPI00247AFAD9|nr:glycoside-pentoside-hexuronide (GPH):cation symporter [Photobacterium sp. DA100]WEM45535.1 glycoside-pentoside-hexuronide (GPH):cation symporter [Photobacterium sp. DA100]